MKKIYMLILLLISISTNQPFAGNVLTLEESIELALVNNNKIKQSKLEIEAARQTKKSALTNFFPSISAGGLKFHSEKALMEINSEGGDLPVYDGDPDNLPDADIFAFFPSSTTGFMEKGTIGYIDALQPVFAGGRIINGNKLASLGRRISESMYRLTEDEVRLKTEKQYRQIISLEEKYRTIEKYEEMLASLLKQVEDAYSSGVVMKNDVLKVRLKQSEILLNKSKLNNGINLAHMAFNQYLGLPLDTAIALESDTFAIESPHDLYVDNQQVLRSRDEYQLLDYSVKARKLQTKIKRGEFMPEIGIGAAYQYLKFDESKDRSFGLIYGMVSVPLSGWWGGSHEIKKCRMEEKIAENNLKDNSELLLLQMDKSWRDLTDAYTQYLLCEESKTQATENLKVNDESYENGLITVSDLLEAQALLRQAEDQLTDARMNYLVEKTKYLQVTGR